MVLLVDAAIYVVAVVVVLYGLERYYKRPLLQQLALPQCGGGHFLGLPVLDQNLHARAVLRQNWRCVLPEYGLCRAMLHGRAPGVFHCEQCGLGPLRPWVSTQPACFPKTMHFLYNGTTGSHRKIAGEHVGILVPLPRTMHFLYNGYRLYYGRMWIVCHSFAKDDYELW